MNSISNLADAINFIKITKLPDLLKIAEKKGIKHKENLFNLMTNKDGIDEISSKLGLSDDCRKYSKFWNENIEKKPMLSIQFRTDFRYFLAVKILFPDIEVNYPDSFGYFDKKE